MNSKEFEILNSKLDYIFDEVERLREDMDHHRQSMHEKELECKFEDAKHELDWTREHRDNIRNYYKENKNNYNAIERNVKERVTYSDYLERRLDEMKERIEER